MKGQVTVYVIIGLLILILLSAYLYLQRPPEIENNLVTETNLIHNYLESCLQNVANEAMRRLGLYGGYVDQQLAAENYQPNIYDQITFLYKSGNVYVPGGNEDDFISFIGASLEDYIESGIGRPDSTIEGSYSRYEEAGFFSCIDAEGIVFGSLVDLGWAYDWNGEIDSEVILAEGETIFILHLPELIFRKQDNSLRVERVRVTSDISAFSVLRVAGDIIIDAATRDLTNDNWDSFNAVNVADSSEININMEIESNRRISVWEISEVNPAEEWDPFKFKFAIELVKESS